MAVREISMGRAYSDNELRKLGIYPTGYEAFDIISVYCPPWHIERNISDHDPPFEEFSVGDSYLKKIKNGNVLRGKIEEGLEVYENHSKIYLVESSARKKIVHLSYSVLGTIILDECTIDKKMKLETGLAKRGFVEFRLKKGKKDPPILEQAINMRLLGIVTYDKAFGKDNRLKERGDIDEHLRISLEEEYEKIREIADQTAIVCKRGDSIKTISKKINRFIVRKNNRISSRNGYRTGFAAF